VMMSASAMSRCPRIRLAWAASASTRLTAAGSSVSPETAT
jgi:hypothetical protein